MRIERKGDGFVIIDEPMVVRGEAAREIREAMDRPVTPEKRAFLEECHQIYLRTRDRMRSSG